MFHFHFLIIHYHGNFYCFFLEKNVPGTSKKWPYHSDLLVLKFKLSLVSEYLNCYCNITDDCWAILGKSKQGEIDDILFKKKQKTFNLSGSSLYPCKCWTKKAFFNLGNSIKLCYTLFS